MTYSNSTFHIRPAAPADDAAIGELLVNAFIHAYRHKRPDYKVSEERQRDLRNVKQKRENGLVLVLEEGEEICGAVCVIRHDSPACNSWLPDHSEIKQMAVLPEHQGTGASGPLIKKAIESCRQFGSRGIVLRVRTGLEGLNRYYERLGFMRDNRGDEKYSETIYLEGFSLTF